MRGVTSDGFRITVFPAASIGASFCASSVTGEFQGVMAATTPTGSRSVIVQYSPLGGVTSDSNVSHAAA